MTIIEIIARNKYDNSVANVKIKNKFVNKAGRKDGHPAIAGFLSVLD